MKDAIQPITWIIQYMRRQDEDDREYENSSCGPVTNTHTIEIVLVNKAKCLACGVTLESKSRHDFRSCGCSNEMFVDGGKDYVRRGAMDFTKVEELSEYGTKEVPCKKPERCYLCKD